MSRFIYVLEDDERSQRDLLNTLKEIDPKLYVRFFNSLAEFHEWLKIAVHEGPNALAKGGRKHQSDTIPDVEASPTHQLRLVLAKNEFLGTQHLGLIRRAREFFLRKKICSVEEPTALLLMAFDNPSFDIKLAEDRIINNVIFKPFDMLILKLHLEYALTGHHPVKTDTLATMQISSKIEMLKDTAITKLTELSFFTLNNHEISIGATRKYYSEIFTTDEKKSVFATCSSCVEVAPKEFLCEFDFYGMDNKQIQNVRKYIQSFHHHSKTDHQNIKTQDVKILILNEVASDAENFQAYLSTRFTQAEYFTYSSFGQLQSDLQDKESAQKKTLPQKIDFVFATLDYFENEASKRWEQLKKNIDDRHKKYGIGPLPTLPCVYLFPNNKLTPDQVLEYSAWSRDIFFMPVDKAYFLKKVFCQNPQLGQAESVVMTAKEYKSQLKVANPVEITQISEAGVVLKYPRAMSIGSFREFILWRPTELEIPEIRGTVNYTEEDKSNAGSFLNHFVFFGMTDYYLKHIRLWLLDSYIQTKEK
jgi:hypothetical protein